MRIIEEEQLDFDDVLIRPKRSKLPSRDPTKGGPNLIRMMTLPNSGIEYEGIPIMASNMDGVGTFSVAEVLGRHQLFTVLRKHYTYEDWMKAATTKELNWDHLAISTGTNAIFDNNAPDYQTLQLVMGTFPVKYICIDVANGYQNNFERFVERIRKEYPDKGLIVGNVCTSEMTEQLIHNCGADIVKLGIGPGSACTTRIHTGVGNPQLSTIIECADAAHGVKGRVIADGGCKNSGDVAKAFCAGGDFVMLGGMLAFHDECEQLIDPQGNLTFYGMASQLAMNTHGARKDGYRSPEGKAVTKKAKGPIEATVQKLLGRLGSTCSYIGAEEMREMTKRATFVKVRRTHNVVFGEEDESIGIG